ncbi:MAG: R3H domain-containing nucleic acid-binding protein [Candidatus Woesebacteria bacterium]|jgi:spoIIIJ-associated protein
MKKNKEEKTKKITKEDIKLVEKISEKLFSLIGVEADPEVTHDEENEAVLVNIDTQDEAGLLIGNRGETLISIQTILGMIFMRETGKWRRILVNVADWREKQEDKLKDLAKQAADRAKESGDEQRLYNLNAAQRRIVHLELAEDKDIETESIGEGVERYLIVKSKKE